MSTNKEKAAAQEAAEKTTVTAETQSEPNPAAEAPAKPRFEGITSFAYVGPSLPRGMLKSNAVMNGTYDEITAYYKDALEAFPQAARLIVPVARFAETKKNAEKPGNIVNKHYNDIVSAIKKKREQEE